MIVFMHTMKFCKILEIVTQIKNLNIKMSFVNSIFSNRM